MRLSDLLKLEAVDLDGRSLDHVRDVRLEQRGDAWTVTHVVVGRAAVAERLGFIHGVVERPVAIAAVMRRIGRHARVVPWSQVSLEDGRLHVDARKDGLGRPEGI